jgi:hypothetical protein
MRSNAASLSVKGAVRASQLLLKARLVYQPSAYGSRSLEQQCDAFSTRFPPLSSMYSKYDVTRLLKVEVISPSQVVAGVQRCHDNSG